MAFRKNIAVTALALGAGIAVLSIGNSSAQAAEQDQVPHSSLIERIVAKFNLDKSEVEKIFDEERAARHDRAKERLENRLDRAVQNGKITEAQKSSILGKHDELWNERQSNREKWRNMGPEERRAEKKERRESIKKWLSDNSIPGDIFGMGLHHAWR